MAKAALGDKQVCPNCSSKFYDLGRRPATCPKCATAFDPAEEGLRVKRTRGRVANYEDDEDEDKKVVAKEEGGDEEEEVEVTPELDAEAADGAIALEDDEEGEAAEGDLPPGFSEEEADLEDDAEDDSVPLIEEDEELTADDIGEIPNGDDEETR